MPRGVKLRPQYDQYGNPIIDPTLRVCAECFEDEGLRRFIQRRCNARRCSFCNRRSRKVDIAARFDEVVDHIKRCLEEYYSSPDDAGMAYEGREGGYQGTTWDSMELINEVVGLELPRDKGNKLLEEIVFGIGDQSWSEKDLYGTGHDDQLAYGWEQFCEIVKHERRFFFLRSRGRFGDGMNPGRVLSTILRYAHRIGLIKTIPAGRTFYRVRKQSGQAFETPAELGPPPAELANQSNRMSPPGIVMTYVSELPDTALRETADEAGDYSVGAFTNDRNIKVLDLAALPPIPSMFEEVPDTLEYKPRRLLTFLHQVEGDMSRPIARDDRVHVEYVPTQVVTEYVRLSTLLGGAARMDGIRYRSSRHGDGVSLVLFAGQDNLVRPDSEAESWEDRWLRLANATTRRLGPEDIVSWQGGE